MPDQPSPASLAVIHAGPAVICIMAQHLPCCTATKTFLARFQAGYLFGVPVTAYSLDLGEVSTTLLIGLPPCPEQSDCYAA